MAGEASPKTGASYCRRRENLQTLGVVLALGLARGARGAGSAAGVALATALAPFRDRAAAGVAAVAGGRVAAGVVPPGAAIPNFDVRRPAALVALGGQDLVVVGAKRQPGRRPGVEMVRHSHCK